MFVSEQLFRRLLSVLGEVSDVGNDPTAVVAVALPRLRQAIGADEVSYAGVDQSTWHPRFSFGYPTPPEQVPAARRVWLERSREHPFLRQHLMLGHQRAVRLSDLHSITELRSMPFFMDFYGPRGLSCVSYVPIGRYGQVVGALTFGRRARDFSDQEHDALELFRRPIGALLRPATARAARAAPGWLAESRRRPDVGLTEAEQRVAELVLDGFGNAQIALQLGVSRKAVEQHLTHIYRKLGLSSRTQLALRLS